MSCARLARGSRLCGEYKMSVDRGGEKIGGGMRVAHRGYERDVVHGSVLSPFRDGLQGWQNPPRTTLFSRRAATSLGGPDQGPWGLPESQGAFGEIGPLSVDMGKLYHQANFPSRSKNPPVGPSPLRVAYFTTTAAASSTFPGPRKLLNSVAVYPGSMALTLNGASRRS